MAVNTLLTMFLKGSYNGRVAQFQELLLWRIGIKARRREAIHSALNTGVGPIIDTLQR